MGAARTKAVASIASRLERPRGFRIVNPGEEELFLAPLPVEKLHGIGHIHAAALAERGVATIGQLRLIPKPVLIAAFGEAVGQQIWERARGLDGREVLLPSTPKSVSRETTIEGGTIDTEFLGGLLEYLSERIGGTLREYGKQACTLGVRLRYVDHFSAHQTMRLERATNDERELLAAARELFTKLFTRRVAIRHVGVSVMNLEDGSPAKRTVRYRRQPAVVSQPRSGSRARPLRLERGLLRQRPGAARALRHQTKRPRALHAVSYLAEAFGFPPFSTNKKVTRDW